MVDKYFWKLNVESKKIYMIELQIANSEDLSEWIYFKNYDRIDESIIFDAIIDKLSKNDNIVFEPTKILPYCILKRCLFMNEYFYVIFDDFYGTYISTVDLSKNVIMQLTEIFN